MRGPFLRKYGVTTTIDFQLFKPDGIDFERAATFAVGDVKIMKDEGVEGNTTNLPSDEGQGYAIALTATEMQAARIVIYLVDITATKVWLDTAIVVETYGHASAAHGFDLDVATQNVNVTQVSGDALAADNLEADYDGTGYNKATSAIGAVDQSPETVHRGDAVGGDAASISLDSAASSTNATYQGCRIALVGGTGAGQSRLVTAYDGATKVATVEPAWTTQPAAGSVFAVLAGGRVAGIEGAKSRLDDLADGDATAANQTTVLNRIGAFTGGGVNTVLGFLKALMRKDAANPTDLGGTYDAAADSNEGIRDRGDTAWSGGGGETQLRSGTAQAGGASTITLDGGASGVDDYYNDAIIALTGGSGAGQSMIISDYVGATKVATVNGTWVTQPDATTLFVILPLGAIPGATAPTAGQVADAVLDELTSDHQTAGSLGAEIHLAKGMLANKRVHTISTGVDEIKDDDGLSTLRTMTPSDGGPDTIIVDPS